jgi:hypothetical protein
MSPACPTRPSAVFANDLLAVGSDRFFQYRFTAFHVSAATPAVDHGQRPRDAKIPLWLLHLNRFLF